MDARSDPSATCPHRDFRPSARDGSPPGDFGPNARNTGPLGDFRSDDRGQLLILTGVLLVMGFVVIGSTLVQVQNLDASAERQTRNNLLAEFRDMLSTFNQTLRDGAVLGETDPDSFNVTSDLAQRNLREAAIRRGIYLTVDRDTTPELAFFQRPSRCFAYEDQLGGVITSYDRTTFTETIVGAVYSIYASDGRQTIEASYYVKIYECLDQTTHIFFSTLDVTRGTAEKRTQAQSAADAGAPMWLNESKVVGLPQNAAVPPGTYTIQGSWTGDVDDLEDNDGDEISRTSSAAPQNATFQIDVSTLPANAVVSSFTMNITARSDLAINDRLETSVTLGSRWSGPTIIIALPVETSTLFVPGQPYGNATWTVEEVGKALWHLDQIVLPPHDAGATWYIDQIEAVLTYTTTRHDMAIEFDMPKIPAIYTPNVLNASWRIPVEKTVGESFFLQVWNWQTESWTTRDTLTYTDGGWQFVDYTLDEATEISGKGETRFQIIDSSDVDTDTVGDADLDILEVDYLRIRSTFTP